MDIQAADVKRLREMTGAGMMACKSALVEANGDFEKAIEILRKAGAAKAAKRADRAANEGRVLTLVLDSKALIWEVDSETDFVARNEDFIRFCESIGPALIQAQPSGLDEARDLPLEAFGGRRLADVQTDLVAKIGENISFSRFDLIALKADERCFSYIHNTQKIGVLVVLASDSPAALQSEAVATLGKDLAMQIAAFSPIAIQREEVPPEVIQKEKAIYTDQLAATGKPPQIIEKIVSGKLDKFFQETVLLEQAFVRDPEQTVADRIREASQKAGASIHVRRFIRYQIGQ